MTALALGSGSGVRDIQEGTSPDQTEATPTHEPAPAGAPSPDLPLPVLLVDDQPSALVLMRALLDDGRLVTVVGEALSGAEALALLPSLLPALAVVDVEMPGMHGFEAARRMMAILPTLRVVLVSATADPQHDALARSVGALAFVPKKELSAVVLVALHFGQPLR